MSVFIILCVCMVTFWNNNMIVFAQENTPTVGTEEDIDYSYFLQLPILRGYANTSRGVYLATGDSAITKINWYTIGAGGNTNAAKRCNVAITCIVERYNIDTDRWGFITSWTAEKENAITVAISKSLVVDSGYYYRVRSLHSAETDTSASYTNALYVGQ